MPVGRPPRLLRLPPPSLATTGAKLVSDLGRKLTLTCSSALFVDEELNLPIDSYVLVLSLSGN